MKRWKHFSICCIVKPERKSKTGPKKGYQLYHLLRTTRLMLRQRSGLGARGAEHLCSAAEGMKLDTKTEDHCNECY